MVVDLAAVDYIDSAALGMVDRRYRDRVAWLEVIREHDQVAFVIGDEGPGFCWHETDALGTDARPCGRELALARLMSSSGLSFNREGNIVTARVQW